MDKTVFSFCTNAAVRRASRRLNQLYDKAIEPSGLRGTQFSLLTQIDYLGTPGQRELADILVMDLSAMGHTLRLLAREGLVRFVPDEKDRRARRVQLTPAGRRKQKEAALLWRKAQARFDARFGKAQSAALRDTMALIASDEFAESFKD
jgi:DNA-binding MarR family transcriptional regulator